MADFQKAVEKVLSLEGGYQNIEQDIGNYSAFDSKGRFIDRANRPGRTTRAGTNLGISAETLSLLKQKAVTSSDLKSLSRSDATNIYKDKYWNSIRGNEIQNQQLAEIILDARVNHGRTGVGILQKVLNKLGARLEIDAKIGPKTLEAIRRFPANVIHDCLKVARSGFYEQIIKANPSQEIFRKGWVKRLSHFPFLSASGICRITPQTQKIIALLLIAILIYMLTRKQ